ncbi:MAG TPA: cytochrome c3 family protein [Rhodothermia bacterium]
MKGLAASCALIASIALAPTGATAQQWGSEEDSECMDCHDDRTLYAERSGRRVSLHVDYSRFAVSVHGKEGCVSCHADIDVDDLPHDDRLEPVECDMCHDDAVGKFEASLHGKALNEGRYLAPTCSSCHGKHDILSSSNEDSKTYVMNIPNTCGTCHKEGTRVSDLRTISQHEILENYSQSIHGDGLFRRGLIVTAVCTSCHSSHLILPHEDPNSTINADNIAATCLQCHTQIERVHLRVVNGELWEKRPDQLPICVDCHRPHQVRRVVYTESFPNEFCMSCHQRQDLHRTEEGRVQSLFVNLDELGRSDHAEIQCVKCHTEARSDRNPVCLDSGKVDCSMCHAGEVEDFTVSTHGQYYAVGDSIAPYCTDCHGSHEIVDKNDPLSPTFSINIPDLCGKCHREGQQAAVAYKGDEHEIVENYTESIHGKGLLESGLLVTATCVGCHTAHRELPSSDTLSTVHAGNIAQTCAQCHGGIYDIYKNSVHSPTVTQTDKELPACNDCHQSHTIKRVDAGDFRQEILAQCGNCHADVTETYFDTFHGKVSHLGSDRTARCYDCHGSHDILPPSDPNSRLSRANVVETCKQCHPNSNRKFVGYLTHATHHDRDKYPYLYYTYWFMTVLLVSVFAFFGLHTLLWVPRAVYERRKAARKERDQSNHGVT